MGGFLFDKVVFGPVLSRRLGISLGINLLPLNIKCCSFNCIYCECGWTKSDAMEMSGFPKVKDVRDKLETRLTEMINAGEAPDSITFAGNGEPTLHPDFSKIIDDTITLRNQFFPHAKVTVLSNASTLNHPDVVAALKKVDINMLKLDAGSEETFRIINKPLKGISLSEIVENMKQFKDNLIIQSLFIKGKFNNVSVDNTSEKNINDWLQVLKRLKPLKVIIYPVERATPAETMDVVDIDLLNYIADKVRNEGMIAEVYC